MARKLSTTARYQAPLAGTVLATASRTPDTVTHQGGAGFAKDPKTALFTLAVANFVGEASFYENGKVRDARYVGLVHQVTEQDPIWVANLLHWLRTESNMRSAAIVGAIEYGRARKPGSAARAAQDAPFAREVLGSVLQRADEPAEALGYWLANYGRPVPKWLKRALGDAALKLYTPFAALKYDTGSAPIRFGDVIEMSDHKGHVEGWKWLVDRAHGREQGDYGIPMLQARHALNAMAVPARRALLAKQGGSEEARRIFREAGMTWESVSGWIQGGMTAEVWEAVIPSMGYMALLRNLRNFDQAGVSDQVAQTVIARLTDPEQVAKSRQLPFRFLSAYLHVPSDRWKHPLAIALDHSLHNVPQFPGKTLVLIDTSGSMDVRMSGRSTVEYWKQAALFGLALARSQAETADVFGFDTDVYPFHLVEGENTLRALDRFGATVHGGGTRTAEAVRRTFRHGTHARVVVLSDQQAAYDWGGGSYRVPDGQVAGGVFDSVPAEVPCWTYDVSGYSAGHDFAGTATRRLVAGLTDSAFAMMRTLEDLHGSGRWPWER